MDRFKLTGSYCVKIPSVELVLFKTLESRRPYRISRKTPQLMRPRSNEQTTNTMSVVIDARLKGTPIAKSKPKRAAIKMATTIDIMVNPFAMLKNPTKH